MSSARSGFCEFDDSQDAESLQLARRIVRGLVLSVTDVVLAPGSRSAPLAYALAEAEQSGAVRLHTRVDERSAAFTALGLALASGRPAAVVTTSGTAAGNLLPAVMEADLSAVPLVAVTADRPEPLHGTGANQTTWQQGMFAGRVRDELHLEQGQVRLKPASRDDMLAAETQTALLLRAGLGTADAPAGPVHLNVGFADPLVPAEGAGLPAPVPTSPAEHLHAAQALGSLDAEETAWEPGPSTAEPTSALFVLGHRAPREAVELARELGQPMLAEPTSGARWSDLGPVQGYRLLLKSPPGSAAARLREQTQLVVVAGRPTLTREVQRLISRDDIDVVQYAPRAEPWHDDRLPRRVVTELPQLRQLVGPAPQEWTQAWETAGLQAQQTIDAVLREEDQEAGSLSSVRVAQFVAETVRTPLLLGSSSVIRDVDLAAALTRDAPREIYAMRGLAGIDGNISAAAGISIGAGRRTTALVGDLTFLHDVNALLVPLTEQPPSLDVVVINDAGGAIFDQLEHGQVGRRPGWAEAVERLFGTPQTVDFEALADAYGHDYCFAEDLEELGEALQHPEDRVGIRIIEVRTDRTRLRDLHARIAEAASELSG
ncbi:2-succinyl-5-enolpyruvyl-6-hydroxy-3-cyclohexene-1-carboxylic-acid synthase [Nesterenkonia sp.]|uniref:2-succinyl-5-enolpyruvyl-6-hydroxy-3- cyclohexene-1-carboxylic-acid synthase n=1 Tax=Nesterenkonia sp. TaxID=704201 RepID=UPI0026133783|nr:2-succinyl-5-enolpyruvyl-6-hydroxy-3-cyclohexene-1-carboxylic-acid synthase [Nesterenkonia sp.]